MTNIFDVVKEAKKQVKMMNTSLKQKPDEKLIKGYNEAMKDYKETGNEQCLQAANFIKKEIDRQKLKLEEKP